MSDDTIHTGIFGLDEMISGGFPKERIILILGGPGAGK
ncbi:KaiC domain-containing protein, partial [Candidatus Bathyarchaeota archaeon]|nr:KaiC domain-containing protein [Candidatus Bathyarchaeota archaeon]